MISVLDLCDQNSKHTRVLKIADILLQEWLELYVYFLYLNWLTGYWNLNDKVTCVICKWFLNFPSFQILWSIRCFLLCISYSNFGSGTGNSICICMGYALLLFCMYVVVVVVSLCIELLLFLLGFAYASVTLKVMLDCFFVKER